VIALFFTHMWHLQTLSSRSRCRCSSENRSTFSPPLGPASESPPRPPLCSRTPPTRGPAECGAPTANARAPPLAPLAHLAPPGPLVPLALLAHLAPLAPLAPLASLALRAPLAPFALLVAPPLLPPLGPLNTSAVLPTVLYCGSGCGPCRGGSGKQGLRGTPLRGLAEEHGGVAAQVVRVPGSPCRDCTATGSGAGA